MNTFKTTACVLSIATAGFAMEMDAGGSDENDNPNLNRSHNTAVKSVCNTPVKTPVNTPVHTPDIGYVTPQNQMVVQAEFGVRGAPTRRLRAEISTPQNIDRLVSIFALSPDDLRQSKNKKGKNQNRSLLGDITVLDPKGMKIFTTGKSNDSCANVSGSPTSVTGMTRLETSVYTPAALQFTTSKNIESRVFVDPALGDTGNAYLPEEEAIVTGDAVNEAIQDISTESFVLHGAGILNTSEAIDQDESLGSFVMHGGNPLNNSADNSAVEEDGDDDALSIIDDQDLEQDNFSDIDDRYNDGYFSSEE